MTLTNMQKINVREGISHLFDELLDFPFDEKPKALFALKAMLKNRLSFEEQIALGSWPSSGNNNIEQNITLDESLLANVNYIREILKDKNSPHKFNLIHKDNVTNYPKVTSEEVNEYIKEIINEHIEHLQEERIEPAKIPTLPIEKKISMLFNLAKKYSGESFTKNKKLLFTVMVAFVESSLEYVLDVKRIPQIHGLLKDSNPDLAQIFLEESLKIRINSMDNDVLNYVLQHVRDQEAINSALIEAIRGKNIHAFDQVMPRIKDHQVLNSALVEAVKRKDNHALDQVIPHIKDQQVLNNALAEAVKVKNNYAFDQIILHIKDQQILSNALIAAIKGKNDHAFDQIIPHIKDQQIFDSALVAAIKEKNNNAIDQIILHIKDQQILSNALIEAVKEGNNHAIKPIERQMKDLMYLSHLLGEDDFKDYKPITDLVQSRLNGLEAVSSSMNTGSCDGLYTHQYTSKAKSNFLSPSPFSPAGSITAHASASDSIGKLFPAESSVFALQAVFSIALILKMCKVPGFTDFVLPSAAEKIKFDHPLPDNSLVSNYEKLLHESPKAQVIANYVKEELNKSGPRKWSTEDVVKFINSPAFLVLQATAKNVEHEARKATEADFGIKHSTKLKRLGYSAKQKYRSTF